MKKAYFLALMTICSTALVAQKKAGYVKGGISFILGGAKTSDDFTSVFALTISPGLRIAHGKEVSLSLESPISVGLSSNDDDDFHFGVELPATINLNFGCAASNTSTAGFGWSIGIGKAYHYSYNEYYFSYDNNQNDELSLWGTMLQTSFYFNKNKSGGCIRFAWISNFSSQPVRKDAIGISLLAILE